VQDTTAIIQDQDIRHVTGLAGSGNMRINEFIKKEEKGWWNSFKSGLGKIMNNNPDEELYQWINDNLQKKGTQWIYRNVNKQFPNRYVRSDIDKALNVIMGRN